MEKHLADRIRGMLFGQALGDAIGLGTEFMSKKEIKLVYRGGYNEYGQMFQDKHRKMWKPGSWTDDTDQMLAILDCILDYGRVEKKQVAQNIHSWAYNGGKGIGNTVYQVLTSSDYLLHPMEVAKRVWVKSNMNGAANGGVMRTAILGVWDYLDDEAIRKNSEVACQVTHYDPRCVGSCVIVSLIISRLLRGETDISSLLDLSKEVANSYDSRIWEYVNSADKLYALKLDERPYIGYTLKTLGAGLWGLRQNDYYSAIHDLVMEGGDSDTNASVAGAILGAKLGYSHLQNSPWFDGLLRKDELNEKAERLLLKMGVDLAIQEPLCKEDATNQKSSLISKLSAVFKRSSKK